MHLKKSGAEAGDTVAVLGIGGLGHMALQYAHRMGFKVVAIGRGQHRADTALALGAYIYLDINQDNPADKLVKLGGAKAILTTIDNPPVTASLLPGLAPEGRLVLLGIGQDPLLVNTGHLVVGERSIVGSITGSPFDNEKALKFCVLTGIRPRIETLPLEKANEAYQRMKSGDVKFRMVLCIASSSSDQELSDGFYKN